jgi:hypothetical protein
LHGFGGGVWFGYATDWPPPSNTDGCFILLPVSCLLGADLWAKVHSQLDKQPHKIVNGSLGFPPEAAFLVILGGALLIISARRTLHPDTPQPPRRRQHDNKTYLNIWHSVRVTIYWVTVGVSQIVIALWCWIMCHKARQYRLPNLHC